MISKVFSFWEWGIGHRALGMGQEKYILWNAKMNL
jgi:hypothetical protein